MTDVQREHMALVERCRTGELSVPVTLMELLLATEDVRVVEQVLAQAQLPALSELYDRNREGCARIECMLRNEPSSADVNVSVEAGLAIWKNLFDTLVEQSEEASVALYSLASPEILAAATEEIAALLERWQLLQPETRMLDLGCGIGRISVALASHVGRIDGVDIAPKMVDTARRRTADLSNVQIHQGTGTDLSAFADAVFDLVLAVDSFPYIVKISETLTDAMFAEVARVLCPGGSFVILNYSYRQDLEQDCGDITALAARHGMQVAVLGERPFRVWNGDAFHLRLR